MYGNVSDVGGIVSDTISINTDKESKTVISNDTFSPESGGNRNPSTAKEDISMHGNKRFIK